MESTLIKTAVLWGQDDVLTRAVNDLLAAGGTWKVIRLCDDMVNETALLKGLGQVIPDVLIINKEAFASDIRLLVKLVQDYSKLTIVTIGLDDNSMEIYSKQTFCLTKASDLLAVIDEHSYSIPEGGGQ